jgi:hypothetical protein
LFSSSHFFAFRQEEQLELVYNVIMLKPHFLSI